jgi:hypothetical protein
LTISSRRRGVRTIGTDTAISTAAALPSVAASAADQSRGIGAHYARSAARSTLATVPGITTSRAVGEAARIPPNAARATTAATAATARQA